MGRKEYLKQWRKDNKEKVNAYKRASYAKNPDVYKGHLKSWRDRNPYRALQVDLCYQAKRRAEEQNVPFDLTPDDIVVPERCPILNLELRRNKGGAADNNSPTLDKIKPELGYVKDNILIVSHRANVVKGNSSYEELKRWVEVLTERQ